MYDINKESAEIPRSNKVTRTNNKTYSKTQPPKFAKRSNGNPRKSIYRLTTRRVRRLPTITEGNENTNTQMLSIPAA